MVKKGSSVKARKGPARSRPKVKPVKLEDLQPTSLPKRLRRVAKKCKLQQRGLAKLLGLTPPAVHHILNGGNTSGTTLQCLRLIEFVLADMEPKEFLEKFIGPDWPHYRDGGSYYRGPWFADSGK